MNRIATVLLVSGHALVATAQTLTNDVSTPVPGDEFVIHTSEFTWDPGPAGTGLTWNLSAMGAGTTMTASYVDPASTPYALLFPTATAVRANEELQLYSYRLGATGSYVDLGIATSNDTVFYDDPLVILTYPCVLGSTWSDDYSSEADSAWGSTYTIADATGTLMMPYGTVSNVLRLAQAITADFIVLGDTLSLSASGYYFYKPGVHEPLLTVGEGDNLNWIDGASVGMAEALRNDIGVEIAPVPATSTITITFSAPVGELTAVVTAADGRSVDQRRVRAGAGILQEHLDVSHMAPGMYCLTLTHEGGGKGTARFVVE